MAVFQDETWMYLKGMLEKNLENALSKISNIDTPYKEILRLQGQVLYIKTLLNLPNNGELIARTQRIK